MNSPLSDTFTETDDQLLELLLNQTPLDYNTRITQLEDIEEELFDEIDDIQNRLEQINQEINRYTNFSQMIQQLDLSNVEKHSELSHTFEQLQLLRNRQDQLALYLQELRIQHELVQREYERIVNIPMTPE